MYRIIRTVVIVALLVGIAGLLRVHGGAGIFELFHSSVGGSPSAPWVAPWNRQQLTDPFRRAPDAVYPLASKWTGVAGPDNYPITVNLALNARGIIRYGYLHTGDGLTAYITCSVNAPPVLDCGNGP